MKKYIHRIKVSEQQVISFLEKLHLWVEHPHRNLALLDENLDENLSSSVYPPVLLFWPKYRLKRTYYSFLLFVVVAEYIFNRFPKISLAL